MAEKLALFGGPKTVTQTAPAWPYLEDQDIEAGCQGLRKSREDTRYLTAPGGGGPVGDFEKRFAEYFGANYAISTCGGGPALHIALAAAGVEVGDEVIVSPYTWGQTVSCILHQNAIPMFADIDPRTYNLSPRAIEGRITSRTQAILVVHLYGHPADMDGIMALANERGLRVIEDCAQASGARYRGRYVGTFGDFGCFSIGSGKNFIGGEGGMLACNDQRLYQCASLVGMHPARHAADLVDQDLRQQSDSLIYTYRIHPLAAVIANSQLDRLEAMNEWRRRNAERLSAGLENIPGIAPPYVAPGCEHAYHMYCPTFVPEQVEGVSRDKWIEALRAEGVPIGPGYVRTPIHLRRVFQEKNYFYGKGCPWRCTRSPVEYRGGDCPVAEDRCARTELTIGGGSNWYQDCSSLMDQYLAGFEKVTANLDALRQHARQ